MRADVKMTDSFELGTAVPAELSMSSDELGFSPETPVVAEAAAPAAPNGFELLGLAPELIAAVGDLGYTQPTTVQSKIGRAHV